MAQRRFALINKQITGAQASLELSDLTDVNTSTPTNRNVLVADGTDWESRALVEADISDLQNYSLVGHTHVEADITDLGSYLENIVEDTTPQLGGNLDAQSFDITTLASLTMDGTLTIQDSTNTDSGTFDHDGTDFNLAMVNTTQFYMSGANHCLFSPDSSGLTVSFTNTTLNHSYSMTTTTDGDALGYSLYNADGAGNPRCAFFMDDGNGVWGLTQTWSSAAQHDFVIDSGGVRYVQLDFTTSLNITENTWVRSGHDIRVYDSSNTDYILIQDSGSNSQINTNNNPIQVNSGGNLFELTTGTEFRIRNSGNTDWAQFDHDGTDFNAAFTNTADWNITGLSGKVEIDAGLDIIGGHTFHIFDTTNTDSLEMIHNGTNFNSTFTNTTNWDIIGLNTALQLRDGAKFRIFNSTDTDYAQFHHDGTDFFLNFVNTTWFRVNSSNTATGALYLQGFESRHYSAGNDKYLRFVHDDTRAIIQSTSGEIWFYADNVNEAQVQDSSDTGVTSGMQVNDHGQTMRDVGYNILPEFNDDVSDTLEAQHCGAINTKGNVTARTLTLEASTSTDFPVEGVTTVTNYGTSGDYTINEGTGTTLYYIEPGTGRVDTAGGCTLGIGGVATIWRESTTTYYIWGSEITA